ncbi:MAG: cytochrome c3 family protein [Desulfobaccales bacterium]
MRPTRSWVIALTLAWGLGAWAATGPTEAPDESWLKIQKPRPEKPQVRFSHKRHPKARIACEQCHHDYQKGRNVWREGQPVEKCQDCHKLLAKRGLIDIQEAFHRQCKGCHLAKRKARQKAGPIQCEGCHPR